MKETTDKKVILEGAIGTLQPEQIINIPALISPSVPKEVLDPAKYQSDIVVAELSKHEVIQDPDQCAIAMEVLSIASKVEKAIENKRTDIVGPWNDEVKKINTYAKDLRDPIIGGIKMAKDAVISFNKKEQEKQAALRLDGRKAQITDMGFAIKPESIVGSSEIWQHESGVMISLTEMKMFDEIGWNDHLQRIASAINEKLADKVKTDTKNADLVEAFGSDAEKEQMKDVKQTAPVAVPVSTPTPQAAAPVKGLTKTWDFTVEDLSQVPREWLMLDETKVRNHIKAGTRVIAGIKIYQKEGLTVR